MKKFVFFILFTIANAIGYSQQYEILELDALNGTEVFYCTAENDDLLGVIVRGTDCQDQTWWLKDLSTNEIIINGINQDSIIIYNSHERHGFLLVYSGCNNSMNISGYITFETDPENPFNEVIVWKRPNEIIRLEANNDGLWSTGEISEFIEVTDPGIYSVTLTNDCGSASYSIEVRDNVELYRATCDLLTNKNQVTWHVTPEQAEYITAVKVYRNTTNLVATVPYTNGSFIDDIGSEATQWQYHLVGVSVEGNDCPIPSYWKRTIHLDRIQDYQGNMILQWTPYEEEDPSKETVLAYGIYDIVNGEAHHVIDVGNFTTVYAYNPADFSGYGAVAAVFSDEKGLEEYAFSNLTSEMLSVGENPASRMVIYPNPSNGKFTVEGVSSLTIYNTMGQMIATSQSEEGTHSFSLSPGIYFVKSGEGTVRKVVVE